jgi:iron only hydrogenase large subunit-like protein
MKIPILLNGFDVETPAGGILIDAVRENGIDLPGLCYGRPSQVETDCAPASCRLCQVEVDGQMVTACKQVVRPGMQVETDTARVRAARTFALQLICEAHAGRCLDCPANLDCALQSLSRRLDGRANGKLMPGGNQRRGDWLFDLDSGISAPVERIETAALVFDPSLCIQCQRCAAVCPTSAIGPVGRGVNRRIGPPPGLDFAALCINCGQCIQACPTGALVEQSAIRGVEAALQDAGKQVVFQIAPAVRVALGESFGLAPGRVLTGKIYAALRRLGVAPNETATAPCLAANDELIPHQLASNVLVTDTNVAADLTIMEEGGELIRRLQAGGTLPIITSCCPGWVKYMETYYPELRAHLSSAKSPQQMLGALCKSYGAQVWGIDPEDMVTVAVMPCTAKKYEAQRPEMNASGQRDVDYVLTTNELARMLQARGIRLADLPDEQADYPFEEYTGAGTLFGNTGGVMEAALRTVHKQVTGDELASVTFEPVRGMQFIKEATVLLNGEAVKVAVLHNLNGGHVQAYLDEIVAGRQDPQLVAVEIMACPGGCIGGGGQPKGFDSAMAKRMTGLNSDDAAQRLRRSHESPVVERIYAEFLGEPGGHQAHAMCHTSYQDRSETLMSTMERVK